MLEDLFHLGIKALVRNESGDILLLKVNPAALKKATEPYWDLPGGRIQRNSTIEETLYREVEEEIGVRRISNIKPINMVLSKIRIPLADSDVGLILGIYSCTIPGSSELKLSREHTEAKWFNAVEAAKLLSVKYPVEFTSQISAISK